MNEERSFFELVDRLEKNRDLKDEELLFLLTKSSRERDDYLAKKARDVRERYYGRDVYLRGLIEFTSYCRNDCYYCGIRKGNPNAKRYRLTEEEILDCCDRGYALGFRTFVLQGGEDPYFTDERMVSLISSVKKRHPDCALTLSIGEREEESYRAFFDAGAERYLLRHETADREHYESLHPSEMSFEHRIHCLRMLRKIGFQVGCGMMVGSPGQKKEHLLKDLRFLQELRPEMIGMGPFVPHHDTKYAEEKSGTVEETCRLISILRLMLPGALIPSTTALGTIDPFGREKGLMAGANVVMPNLSPTAVREKYLLYDHKICTGEEAAECVECLSERIKGIGYVISKTRGDPVGEEASAPFGSREPDTVRTRKAGEITGSGPCGRSQI